MATAFGVRLLGTALVVNFDSAAMIDVEVHSGPLPGSLKNPEMTTKAVPSNRTPKASPIYAQASTNYSPLAPGARKILPGFAPL
jgi:hypothetical protein